MRMETASCKLKNKKQKKYATAPVLYGFILLSGIKHNNPKLTFI